MMTVRMSPLRRLTFGYVLSLLAIAAILVVGQQVVAGYPELTGTNLVGDTITRR